MKRCLESYFSSIPQEVFHIIDDNVEPIEKSNLVMTCKSFAQYHFNKVVSLCLVTPQDPPSIKVDIYAGILERYPNLQKLEIDLSHYQHISAFISNLKAHPINSLIKVTIHEIDQENAKELNCSLLNSFLHPKLESVVIQTLRDNSILSKEEIQPFLNQAVNIKKFKWKGNKKSVVSLSFHNQAHLISAKFKRLLCPPKTIESLRLLPSFQTLIIYKCSLTALSLLQVLSKEKWNVKKLALPGLRIDTDEELIDLTKQFPELEEFDNTNRYLTSLTKIGMESIGLNCKKLRVLRFSDWNFTNEDIDAVTKPLSLLESLSFSDGYTVTDNGMISIANNCHKLHTLEMKNIRKITKISIDAMVQANISLISFKLKNCVHFTFEDLRYFVQKMPKLTTLIIRHVKLITDENLETLIKEFPQLS